MELFRKGSDRLRPIDEEDEARNSSDRTNVRRVDRSRDGGMAEADVPPTSRGRRHQPSHQPSSAPGQSAFMNKSHQPPSGANNNKQPKGMSDRIVELEDDRPKRMIDLYDLQYPGDLSVDGSQMSFGVSATDLSLSCGTTVSFRFGKKA